VRSARRAWVTTILAAVAAGVVLVFGPMPSAPEGPTSTLPDGAESTQVARLQAEMQAGRNTSDVAPAIVVFDRKGEPLTAEDLAVITHRVPHLAGVATGGGTTVPPEPVVSADGTAALVSVPLRLGDPGLADAVGELRSTAKAALPVGLRAQVTGAPAYEVDLSAVFDGADSTLLLATAGVVALLLLITYRSPVLWLVPLGVVAVADQVSVRFLGVATHLFGFAVDEAITGITSVLVFGAGTNYALLLIARYRENLRHQEDRRRAMASALAQAGPAILASSGTVVLALLSLSFARDPFIRGLGYAGALGIATAVGAALVVLPAVLVLFGRGLFWPLVPRVGQSDPTRTGIWARVGLVVTRRPVPVVVASVAMLVLLACGLAGASVGLTQDQQFRDPPEAVTGQAALAAAFPAGAAEPTVVLAPSQEADAVAAAAATDPGVAAVRPGRVADGTTRLDVVLTSAPGSAASYDTVDRLRENLPGGAIVGGPDAETLDAGRSAAHDRRVVIPLVLGIVLVILLALLRSIVAAVVLVTTVVATFVASMGASWWLFENVLDYPALDTGVPILAFLFLVALGVDYNIFLSTRAREEARDRPTVEAIRVALAVTGGVITSAGVLLASVFAVLGVLPVITLTQIGIIVGLGVLLDTLLVRSVVVPALVALLGDRFWWPGHPHRKVRLRAATEARPPAGSGRGGDHSGSGGV
jgi:RND superfamily putative drug exporter